MKIFMQKLKDKKELKKLKNHTHKMTLQLIRFVLFKMYVEVMCRTEAKTGEYFVFQIKIQTRGLS